MIILHKLRKIDDCFCFDVGCFAGVAVCTDSCGRVLKVNSSWSQLERSHKLNLTKLKLEYLKSSFKYKK